jgi:hypothetical protein
LLGCHLLLLLLLGVRVPRRHLLPAPHLHLARLDLLLLLLLVEWL